MTKLKVKKLLVGKQTDQQSEATLANAQLCPDYGHTNKTGTNN